MSDLRALFTVACDRRNDAIEAARRAVVALEMAEQSVLQAELRIAACDQIIEELLDSR